MRLRRVKKALETVENSKYIILNPEEHKGKINEIFGNNNSIFLEIGMGKGDFIIQNAINHPENNYIGLEK